MGEVQATRSSHVGTGCWRDYFCAGAAHLIDCVCLGCIAFMASWNDCQPQLGTIVVLDPGPARIQLVCTSHLLLLQGWPVGQRPLDTDGMKLMFRETVPWLYKFCIVLSPCTMVAESVWHAPRPRDWVTPRRVQLC